MTRVVLLHSALGDSSLWDRQVALLRSRGFDPVAPDLPGFGSEPMPREEFSYVERVAALLPGVLVGNSFGGAIALRTALAHPGLVSKLVLVAPGFPDWSWSQELREHFARDDELCEAGDFDAATELNLDFWVAPEHRDRVRPLQRRALDLQTAHEPPPVRWPDFPSLSSLTTKTLVIVGDRDKRDFRQIAAKIAAEAANARLEVIAGAGHLVALDKPDELEALLLAFLGAPVETA